jgi:hypothetical protein
MRELNAVTLALLICSALTGCATYQNKVASARESMQRGQAGQAAKDLEPLAKEEGNDQLVYLLDYATVLQQAGQYQQSASMFGRAEKIADIQDYHSVSKVTTAALLSEEMIQYKGDDYEKVLINAVNAINFLEMGDLDGALVEVRRLNGKLYKFKYEAKREYQQSPYAFYLSALIYEAGGKWDDAYISFKQAYEVAPQYQPLHEDLVRSAIRAQRNEDVDKWLKKFPEVKVNPEWRDKSYGEAVLVLLQGWGPRKHPRPEAPRFPHLVPVRSEVQSARLVVNGDSSGAVQSETIFSVQEVAIKTLNDDYARLVASRVGGVVAKAVVADQIAQKNKLLGQLAYLAMNAVDRADLRQWSTLPQTFQFARVPLRAGKYRVSAMGVNSQGYPTGEQMAEREIEVKPGRKAFISWRTVR